MSVWSATRRSESSEGRGPKFSPVIQWDMPEPTLSMDGRAVCGWLHGNDIQRQQIYVFCRIHSLQQAIHADFDSAYLLLGVFDGLGKRNGAVLGLASDLDVATGIGPETSHGGQHFDQPAGAWQQ